MHSKPQFSFQQMGWRHPMSPPGLPAASCAAEERTHGFFPSSLQERSRQQIRYRSQSCHGATLMAAILASVTPTRLAIAHLQPIAARVGSLKRLNRFYPRPLIPTSACSLSAAFPSESSFDFNDFLPKPETVLYWLAIIALGYGVYYVSSLLSTVPDPEESEEDELDEDDPDNSESDTNEFGEDDSDENDSDADASDDSGSNDMTEEDPVGTDTTEPDTPATDPSERDAPS